MSDLISRAAALEALEEPCKVSDTWTDEYAVGERMQWEKDVKALNSLPFAQPEQRWIPCSERLPDKSNFYICTKKNRLVKTVWYSVLDGAWEENVDAWMTLPEPYREESE